MDFDMGPSGFCLTDASVPAKRPTSMLVVAVGWNNASAEDNIGEPLTRSVLMETLHWLPEYASGLPSMDAAHREFLDCVNVLLTCSDGELQAGLDPFSTHAVAHFRDEDRLMANTAYPSAGCHLDEHAA